MRRTRPDDQRAGVDVVGACQRPRRDSVARPVTQDVGGGSPVVGGGQVVPRPTVDSSGRFSFQSVVPDTYTVDVIGPGGIWTAKSAMVGGKDTLDYGLQVRGGDAIGEIDVALTNSSTQMSGALLDANAKP